MQRGHSIVSVTGSFKYVNCPVFTARVQCSDTRTEICQRSMHAFPCGCKAVKIMFLCVSLTFFRTNQQIQTKAMALLMALLQTAGDSDRKVPLLLFKPFMHFLFSTLVKLQSVQMIRYFSLARSSSSVSASRRHRAYCSSSVTLKVWLFYRRRKTLFDVRFRCFFTDTPKCVLVTAFKDQKHLNLMLCVNMLPYECVG